MRWITLLAALAGLTSMPAAAQSNLIILTGSTSGVYYPLGNSLSSVFMKAIPGARASVQVTQGSVENLRLLESGDGELAFSLGDTLSAAWKGNAEAGFKAPLTRLRAVAAIYPNHIQIVVREASGVTSLAELKGKRVSVGPKQSGTELNARAIFAAAGMQYADFARTDYLPFGQSAKMIEQGELDATLQSAGLGVDSIRHLSTAVPIRMLPVPKDIVLKVGDPAYVPAVIPPRTYEGQSDPVETVGVVNFLVTNDGVSNDMVYAMTKSLFANLGQLVQTHPAARGISVKDALTGLPLPLHPGAERYYREVGLLR
jgi:TRAP transporter TAXI family solute receptor